MEPKAVEKLIADHIQCQLVKVDSADQRHYTAVIVSDEFEGQNRIKRHRMVYSALGEKIQDEIHAFSFRAYTNKEYQDIK